MILVGALSTKRTAAFLVARSGRATPATAASAAIRKQQREISLFAASSSSNDGDSIQSANPGTLRNNKNNYRSSQPPARQRRFSSSNDNDNWIVPDYIKIPEDQLNISFTRSSGPGGQNVNKVNTCVHVRFHVDSAGSWMPYEVRQRFHQKFRNRINKDGYYQTESQEHRTQTANKKTVLQKLQDNVLSVWPRPKIRKQRTGISEKGKEIRKDLKEQQKRKKELRKRVEF